MFAHEVAQESHPNRHHKCVRFARTRASYHWLREVRRIRAPVDDSYAIVERFINGWNPGWWPREDLYRPRKTLPLSDDRLGYLSTLVGLARVLATPKLSKSKHVPKFTRFFVLKSLH